MDENFKIIYEILKKLENSMDISEFDNSILSYKSLEISKPKWCRIIKMLFDSGYITGVNVWESYDCSYPQVELTRPEITLKGLEYLRENSIMQRMKYLNAPSREQRNSLTVVLRQRLSPTLRKISQTLRKSRKERQQKQLKTHL